MPVTKNGPEDIVRRTVPFLRKKNQILRHFSSIPETFQ